MFIIQENIRTKNYIHELKKKEYKLKFITL